MYDLDDEPYIRGSTPPEDLQDLNSRYRAEDSSQRIVRTETELGPRDLADDLSDFDFDVEVEKISDTLSSVPAPRGPVPAVNPIRADSDRDPPTPHWPGLSQSVDRGQTPAVNPVRAGSDLDPPTPHWPGLSQSVDREQTPALNPVRADSDLDPPTPHWPGLSQSVDREQTPAVNAVRVGREVSPPTPHWPGLSPSIGPEQTPAIPYGLSSPHSHDVTTQLPFHEEPEALDPESPRNVSPSVIDTTSQEDSDEGPTEPSAAAGTGGGPAKSTGLCDNSPRILQAPFLSLPIETHGHRDPSKWISITPSSARTSKSSSVNFPSGFVDNGVTASFQPPIRLSPPVREVQDTSPTGLTLMRESRLRAKEAEENQARKNALDEKTNLEEGIDIRTVRPKYPEHPSFHAPGDFTTLAGHHRVASSFRGSNPESTQPTYPAVPSPSPRSNTNFYSNVNPSPSPRSNTSFYSNVNPSSSPGFNAQDSQGARYPRGSPGLHAPSSQGTYSGALEYMNQQYSGMGPYYNPISNRNHIQTFNAGSSQGNVQGRTSFSDPVSTTYPSLSPYSGNLYSTPRVYNHIPNSGFNPDIRNPPVVTQRDAPPNLNHKSSSSDSLRVFPPTPAGAATPRIGPSSINTANPSRDYLAGVSPPSP